MRATNDPEAVMRLEERIYAERVVSLSELTTTERAIVDANPALKQAIQENNALPLLTGNMPAPKRDVMLEQAYRAAKEVEEPKMTNIFSGKRWYVQVAIAVALIAVVAAFWLLPQEQSWAQVEGYMLQLDFGAVDCSDGDIMAKPPMSALPDVLEQFKVDYLEDGDEAKIMMRAKVEEGNLTLTISLTTGAEDNEELLEALQEALAATPGMPAPSIVPSTWYCDENGPCFGGDLNLDINGHMFNFPEGATEEEIETAINDWLAVEYPDSTAKADVTIFMADHEKKITMKVVIPGSEGEKSR